MGRVGNEAGTPARRADKGVGAADETFARTLTEALARHHDYWGESAAPRAQVTLGPQAMACLAHDYGFPVAPGQPYLPTCLLNRERIEDIP